MPRTNDHPATTLMRWLCLCILLVSGPLQADTNVRASVDRSRLALEETLILTLSADSILFSGEPDVSSLEDDFHILNRQQSSRTNIINGDISSSRQWDYTLAPKREGDITIPAIAMGDKFTKAITITVEPATSSRQQRADNRQVWLEADINPRRGYVQQMLEYSVKLFSSVNFLDASLDALEVDNALVESLGESRYRQRIDGRTYQVIERRYAIFPQRSGPLDIPALTLQARVESYRPSLLDPGRLLVRRSPPIQLDIQAPPAEFDGAVWLPASKLEIFEEWSGDPEQLQVGQSITRRVDIRAEGLMAAQLPALPAYALADAKVYPDQPSLQNSSEEQILVGLRSESSAIIPTRPGRYELPEIRIAWWDTRNNQPQLAVLPARQVHVVAAPGSTDTAVRPPVPLADTAPNSVSAPTAEPSGAADAHSHLTYYIAIAVLLLGNLLSLFLLARRTKTAATPPASDDNSQQKTALAALRKACKQRDTLATRAALQHWAQCGQAHYQSLETLADRHPDLAPYIAQLNAALYAPNGASPDFAGLLNTVTSDRRSAERKAKSAALPELYPPLKS
ncbi:BatD family protein [Spongiibacter sp.]|uniref:BatD family protein n=1 Tax=Spongiibacter sp. TaxID=2024860 RepID=UPI00356B5395